MPIDYNQLAQFLAGGSIYQPPVRNVNFGMPASGGQFIPDVPVGTQPPVGSVQLPTTGGLQDVIANIPIPGVQPIGSTLPPDQIVANTPTGGVLGPIGPVDLGPATGGLLGPGDFINTPDVPSTNDAIVGPGDILNPDMPSTGGSITIPPIDTVDAGDVFGPISVGGDTGSIPPGDMLGAGDLGGFVQLPGVGELTNIKLDTGTPGEPPSTDSGDGFNYGGALIGNLLAGSPGALIGGFANLGAIGDALATNMGNPYSSADNPLQAIEQNSFNAGMGSIPNMDLMQLAASPDALAALGIDFMDAYGMLDAVGRGQYFEGGGTARSLADIANPNLVSGLTMANITRRDRAVK